MKKLFCMFLGLMLLAGNACATIMEPKGVDLAFKLSTGIEAREAVVLCRSLSAHLDHDATSRKMKTLSAGYTFLTSESVGEWQNCFYEEGKDPIWVRDYYLANDPAWYITDGQTAVYAYDDLEAPRVALLGRNEELPILLETEEWCVVGLRGASGWIRKTSKDRYRKSWFDPDSLHAIIRAELNWPAGYSAVEDPYILSQLSGLLTDVRDLGESVSGCPFGVYLTLTTEDEQRIVIELASDSCAIYRAGGRDYRFGNSTHISNTQLYSLFPEYTPHHGQN